MIIPENFTDFLSWFKEATQTSWANKEEQAKKDIALVDAKWIGMDESQIDEVEKKFKIRFPPDHRAFLKILHTINIKQTNKWPFFFNWLEDEKIIIQKLNEPYLFHDKIWLELWGYLEIPKLIPIFGHRYIVSEPFKNGNPVLSIVGFDIIVYGWNLKHYLLNEFAGNLPYNEVFQKIYDEEESKWIYEFKDEIQDIFDLNWLTSSYDNIPYWGELIKQNEGSWKYQPRRR